MISDLDGSFNGFRNFLNVANERACFSSCVFCSLSGVVLICV